MKPLFHLIFFSLLLSLCSCGGTETGNPVTNETSGEDAAPSETAPLEGCDTDKKTCSDGSQVERDPDNNCEFKKCPGE